MLPLSLLSIFFFFNDTATTEIYTLSLHDALPIYLTFSSGQILYSAAKRRRRAFQALHRSGVPIIKGSEEHTSELQSPCNLVCRLLLEKKIFTCAPHAHTASFIRCFSFAPSALFTP